VEFYLRPFLRLLSAQTETVVGTAILRDSQPLHFDPKRSLLGELLEAVESEGELVVSMPLVPS
jgi:hypothetical protein